MFLKPKHFIFECRPNFGSFCPLPGLLRAITFSAPKPPPPFANFCVRHWSEASVSNTFTLVRLRELAAEKRQSTCKQIKVDSFFCRSTDAIDEDIELLQFSNHKCLMFLFVTLSVT